MSANLPMFPPPPFYQAGSGISTPYGTFVPPGSRHCFVRSTGVQSGDPEDIANRILPTLAAGLGECRSGMNDYVFVLPGHTENITGAGLTGLVANTNIVGVGNPNASNAPTFIWTNTAGNFAVNVNNVAISGLHLQCDSANGITSAITVTGTGCSMAGNYISWAKGATSKSAIGITVDTGATDFLFAGNYVTGTATHNVTNGILVQGATVPSRLRIIDNVMIASATAANGLINISVAALNIEIARNRLYNTHTSSTSCVTIGAVAADGMINDNYAYVKATGAVTSGTTGFKIGAGSLVMFGQNFVANDPGASALLLPTVDT